MSYQAFARKWRPRTFNEVVGQTTALAALTHALQSGRVHHAYLFTGQRGVGKTTLARILAKSLNCVEGITDQPCGQCEICTAIDQGRFIDVQEIDAASRTKVEDTRELLENVSYQPSRGRYKIYLIDEVHMLSQHSFNALLKTLEEPPSHVVFLLATTDPQKLPPTIVSRCLRFHLSNISLELIQQQLAHVLQQEAISYEDAALPWIARAAEGSLRDALSLLEQAVAYGHGMVKEVDVREMLAYIDPHALYALLDALITRDGKQLLSALQQALLQSNDDARLLEQLITLLHHIALQQIVPDYAAGSQDACLADYAKKITPEDIQLFYQIALHGRRDLPFAPEPRIGLEMTLLRMLAFVPVEQNLKPVAPVAAAPVPSQKQEKIVPPPVAAPVKTAPPVTQNNFDWYQVVEALGLSGPSYQLASHCVLQSFDGKVLQLQLEAKAQHLLSKARQDMLTKAISSHCSDTIQVHITPSEAVGETPFARRQRVQGERVETLQQELQRDPMVQHLQQHFEARLEPGSIVPR